MSSGIVSQSNFIPWRGYFAALRLSNQLIMYDTQQYTRRDWRNRNLIASDKGQEWLTLAVKSRGNYYSPINRIEVVDRFSLDDVIQRYRRNYRVYAKTAGFKFVEKIFSECTDLSNLSEINSSLTRAIADYLEIELTIESDQALSLSGNKNDKLIQVCNHFDIDVYLTGPSAKNYLDEAVFAENHITVKYLDYSSLCPIDIAWEPSIIHWITTKEFNEVLRLTHFSQSNLTPYLS
jgi:hypothetical protein